MCFSIVFYYTRLIALKFIFVVNLQASFLRVSTTQVVAITEYDFLASYKLCLSNNQTLAARKQTTFSIGLYYLHGRAIEYKLYIVAL